MQLAKARDLSRAILAVIADLIQLVAQTHYADRGVLHPVQGAASFGDLVLENVGDDVGGRREHHVFGLERFASCIGGVLQQVQLALLVLGDRLQLPPLVHKVLEILGYLFGQLDDALAEGRHRLPLGLGGELGGALHLGLLLFRLHQLYRAAYEGPPILFQIVDGVEGRLHAQL